MDLEQKKIFMKIAQSYCEVATSRLTGERAMVSCPCSLTTAQDIVKRENSKPSRLRVWLRHSVAIYPYKTKIIL